MGVSKLLNSANQAIQKISNTTNGLVGGTFAQPNVNLFGVNIPGVPLISFRDYFLKQMESWVSSIPMRTQYIIFFDSFPVGLTTGILQSLEPIQGDKKNFDINRAKAFVTSFPYQGIAGCIFAQGADIPDDVHQTSVAPIQNNRGFIPGVIGNNREQFQPLTLQFRETNTSFIDHIIRPWVIFGAHKGLVARDRNIPEQLEQDPRCNITIVQYSRSFQKMSQIPRKVWHYYNCVPTSVSNRNLTYDAEALDIISTRWTYSHYGVSDNLYLPLPDIIDKLF